MATAWWHPIEPDKPSVNKKVAVPKRASSLSQWLKSVKKVIPEVPWVYTDANIDIDPDYIKVSWPNVGWLYIDRSTRRTL